MPNINLGTSDEIYWWQTTSSRDNAAAAYSSPSNPKTNLNPDEQEILSKPLLAARDSNIKSFSYDSDSMTTFEGEKAIEEQPTTLRYLVVSILALGGIATSVASIALAAGFGMVSGPTLYLVVGAGGLTSVMAPVMYSNEKVMSRSESKRAMIRKLKEQVDNLATENKKLKNNNDNLEVKVDELKSFEERLGLIIETSGASVNTFVKLVKENKKITDDKQSVVKTIVLQDLIGLLIKQDTNKNFQMDEGEMEQLVLALNTYGVVIDDEEAFRKKAMENPSIDAVLIVVKNYMDGQVIQVNKVMDVRESRGSNVFDAQSLRLSL